MNALPWLILFLPLAAAGAITLGTLDNRSLSARLSIGAVVASFLFSLLFVAVQGFHPAPKELILQWLEVGDGAIVWQVDFGLRLDALSLLMMCVVTGVAAVIHIYSVGYLGDDRGFSRYFACLSLFTFSMLGIVLANNFLMLFVFWELVGVSSYLLIGFWYERAAAADAAQKAFITNRLGDFGFFLGILLVWGHLGSLNFSVIESELRANPQALGALATAAGLLIFCGAVGKSAQFPLHVWLPDAMEGPTPVSALIHAATMVAAGVYMLCRVFFLLDLPGSYALSVIAWIGGFTALLAALIAVQQNDIKRILAYSTLSQLGYMIMAVGLGAPAAAMFHLTTHAFFKALLFLGAGAVIHALHHQQDIWQMGALRNKMPVTFATFLCATFALCGIPPLSGFFSKDAILAAAAQSQPALFVLGAGVAFLTTFYMFRLVLVVFYGASKSPAADAAREAPPVMTWPLIALALPTALAGFFAIEPFYAAHFASDLGHETLPWWRRLLAPFEHSPLAAGLGLFAVIAGFSAAYACYRQAPPDPLSARLGAAARVLRNRFYFDEFYAGLISRTHEATARAADWFDRWIIAGFAVRGVHGTTELLGRTLRLFQTGNLQTYAFLFVMGAVGLLYWILLG